MRKLSDWQKSIQRNSKKIERNEVFILAIGLSKYKWSKISVNCLKSQFLQCYWDMPKAIQISLAISILTMKNRPDVSVQWKQTNIITNSFFFFFTSVWLCGLHKCHIFMTLHTVGHLSFVFVNIFSVFVI